MRLVSKSLATFFLIGLATSALTPALARAQAPATGRIVGRVLDAASGAGLTDAGIQVVGTTVGTMSVVDGRFTIRVAIGNLRTEARHVDRVWALLRKATHHGA